MQSAGIDDTPISSRTVRHRTAGAHLHGLGVRREWGVQHPGVQVLELQVGQARLERLFDLLADRRAAVIRHVGWVLPAVLRILCLNE